jgi:ATP-dependent Clp protease ATP-binding subunit ClpA
MSDPIAAKEKKIEAMIGEAAAVARKYHSPNVGSDHLLYVIAGTEEGRRIIESMKGNPRRLREFLQQTFDYHSRTSSPTAQVNFDHTLQAAIQPPIERAREQERPVRLSEIIAEMCRLGTKCMTTREALRAGNVLDTPNLASEDDYRIDEEVDDLPQDAGEGMSEMAASLAAESNDSVDEDGGFAEELLGAETASQGKAGDAAAKDSPSDGNASEADETDEHLKAVRRAIRNLSEVAQAGGLDPVIGREREIGRLCETLTRRRKSNVLLVGEAGVGKTALAEGLALRLASGQVPDDLKNRPLLEVSINDMVAGAKFRGDFEARMHRLIDIARESRAILFIDEVHTLVGSGASGGRGGLDGANILKPALARGEFSVIGATTTQEVREIRKDGALMRRFDLQHVCEPSAEQTRRIIDEAVGSYILHHQISIEDTILDAVVAFGERYLPQKRFPDKAFDLIDASAVIARARSADEVSMGDLRLAVSRCGGPTLGAPEAEKSARIAGMEEALGVRVFGQEKAIIALANAARGAMMGLQTSGIAAAYLFNGPSGCGKTALAEAYAAVLGLPVIRINMNEYTEKHSVSRLIGAPPGYVGYETEGILVTAADTHPEFVLLLDEIEKAHPDVYDVLLQVIDKGIIRAGDGREVPMIGGHLFVNANVGAAESEKPVLGFGRERNAQETMQEHLAATFRKEFLARFTARIQFEKVDQASAARIVSLEINRVTARLADSGYGIDVADGVSSWILDAGEDLSMGGRSVEGDVTEMFARPLTEKIIESPGCMHFKVWIENDCIEIVAASGAA